MANNLKVVKKFADQLQASIKTELTQGDLVKLGSQAKKQIIKRTRLGRGVSRSGQTFNFPQLSSNYIEQRVRYRRNLSKKTTTNTSNVHATGQLVEKSIKVITNSNKFILFINKARGRTLSGGSSKIDNIKLNRLLGQKGRRWFDLSRPEQVFITREIRKIILGI